MILEAFKDALDELGVGHRESGVSLNVESCPECGQGSYKVYFRIVGVDEDEQLFGSCKRGSCGQGYSSFSYLLKSGLSRTRVSQAHGLDPNKNLGHLSPIKQKEDLLAIQPGKVKQLLKPVVAEVDTTGFFSVESWSDHPAAVYAVKRGYVPEFTDIIQIEPLSNSVVFLVNNGAKTIGFQKRFLKPIYTNMKTQTSLGFSKSKHILKFPRNNADIVICEGPFTALSAWHYGYYGVCTFGSSVSKEQIDMIIKLADLNGVKIGVACEDDAAGRKSLNNLRCALYWAGKELFRVIPNSGSDLNDAWQLGLGCSRVDLDEWPGPGLPQIDTLKLF